tara:strand:- start:3929 stop:4912 length:984 start_codon:yes stop_codon:yes gene_type:complete
MSIFVFPAGGGGNLVGVDLVRQDVPNTNQGGNTIVYEGYTPEACTLAEITVFMKTLNTQGTYTATFTNVTTGNTVLGSANFNMQTLSADTWTTLTLTGASSDLTFAADDRFRVSFTSNNAAFDGTGVYFTMRFTSNTSFTPRAMDLLFSTTLTTDANSVTTGTLPTGYKSYKILVRARTDRIFFHVSSVNIYFNNDETLNNYRFIRANARSNKTDAESLSQDIPGFASAPSAAGDAHLYGATCMHVLSPESSTGYKSFTVVDGYVSEETGTSSAQRGMNAGSGVWLNQAAITSILFKSVSSKNTGGGANLPLSDMVPGTSIQVYGLR